MLGASGDGFLNEDGACPPQLGWIQRAVLSLNKLFSLLGSKVESFQTCVQMKPLMTQDKWTCWKGRGPCQKSAPQELMGLWTSGAARWWLSQGARFPEWKPSAEREKEKGSRIEDYEFCQDDGEIQEVEPGSSLVKDSQCIWTLR